MTTPTPLNQLLQKLQRPATSLLLVLSLTLGALVTQTNCEQLTVKDPITGLLRPATTQEIQEIYGQTAATAGQVATSLGFPQAAPILSLLGQLAALWAAWSIRPRVPQTLSQQTPIAAVLP